MPPVEVTLEVQRIEGSGAGRPVQPGARLKSGDRIILSVTAEQEMYPYVVQRSPSGRGHLLFPYGKERDLKFGRGSARRIPEDGGFFQLDDEPGDESIYLIASLRPIAQADPELAERFGLGRSFTSRDVVLAQEEPPPPPPPPPSEPPDPAGVRKRGLGGADSLLRVRTNERGVAVLRFWFRHERAE